MTKININSDLLKKVFETDKFIYYRYIEKFIKSEKLGDGAELLTKEDFLLEYMIETRNPLFYDMNLSYIHLYQKLYSDLEINDIIDSELCAEDLYLKGQGLV